MTETLNEFLAQYDPDGTRTTRFKIDPHTSDKPAPMFLFEDPDGRVAIVVPMPYGDYLDVDVHGFHADGTDAALGVAGWNQGFQFRLEPGSPNAPKETGNNWLGARLVALFID